MKFPVKVRVVINPGLTNQRSYSPAMDAILEVTTNDVDRRLALSALFYHVQENEGRDYEQSTFLPFAADRMRAVRAKEARMARSLGISMMKDGFPVMTRGESTPAENSRLSVSFFRLESQAECDDEIELLSACEALGITDPRSVKVEDLPRMGLGIRVARLVHRDVIWVGQEDLFGRVMVRARGGWGLYSIGDTRPYALPIYQVSEAVFKKYERDMGVIWRTRRMPREGDVHEGSWYRIHMGGR